MRAAVTLLTLGALAGASITLTAAHPAPARTPVSPCDGRRCPNLTMRTPAELHLIRTSKGRSLLASTNAIVNAGTGPLELRGRKVSPTQMEARQVIRGRRKGDTVLPRAGTIEFYDTKTRGRYWKYEKAARFELWRLDAGGHPTHLVRTGPKLDYCFRDLERKERLDAPRHYKRSPVREHFGACDQSAGTRRVTLGTSVGWADVYPSTYPQNWIDVTGRTGCFLYVHRADPDDNLTETREDDNTGVRVVRLPWRGPGRRGCRGPTNVPDVGLTP